MLAANGRAAVKTNYSKTPQNPFVRRRLRPGRKGRLLRPLPIVGSGGSYGAVGIARRITPNTPSPEPQEYLRVLTPKNKNARISNKTKTFKDYLINKNHGWLSLALNDPIQRLEKRL